MGHASRSAQRYLVPTQPREKITRATLASNHRWMGRKRFLSHKSQNGERENKNGGATHAQDGTLDATQQLGAALAH